MKPVSNRMPGKTWRILQMLFPKEDVLFVEGEFEEIYAKLLKTRGKTAANLWMIRQLVRTGPLLLMDSSRWRIAMFKNFLFAALRHAKKDKTYTILNVMGLTLGFAVSLLSVLYVMEDLTYDRFFQNEENIYRILSIGVRRGTKNAITAGPLVAAVREEIPEVIESTRIARMGRIQFRTGPEAEDLPAVLAQTLLVDNQFFRVFGFKIFKGNPEESFLNPNAVFLTPEKADALFGEEDPMGKSLTTRGNHSLFVAGLVESPPPNCHIQFEALIPLIPEQNPVWWNSWKNLALIGYVVLSPDADLKTVEDKMESVARNHGLVELFTPRLQALKDIHLGSMGHLYDSVNHQKNNPTVVRTMGGIGILVLLVAVINFVSMTTARTMNRAVEISMRKVIGSSRLQVAFQFLAEFLITALVAYLLALILLQISLPFLRSLLEKNLILTQNLVLVFQFGVAALLAGLLSGLYPAFLLSAFEPGRILRGQFQTSRTGVVLRRILVVVQFSITTALIVSVLMVKHQVWYLQERDLGYRKEDVLITFSRIQNEDVLKQDLLRMPDIISIGRMDAEPGENFHRIEIRPEGHDPKDYFTASSISMDESLFEALGIPLVQGRNLSGNYPSDASDGVVINQTLAQKAQYADPVGRTIRFVDDEGNVHPRIIVGVVRDFHFVTCRQKIESMIFFLNPRRSPLLVVRTRHGSTEKVRRQIEERMRQYSPESTPQLVLLNTIFDKQFEPDRKLALNMGILSALGILIASLGLIGMVAYSVEQRLKEIVIRKILGCRSRAIAGLLVGDSVRCILLANAIAWPMGYLGMLHWLEEFEYQMELQLWPFLFAALFSLAAALIVIAFQILRASRTNPIDVLRKSQ